ncbi:hypothetical protein HU200_065863 [Digitaria exilis]|uniref:Reverse transcriptase zinc-binding domain-containing protein n=1 Tax=Digitaria exilis TaxID=1010633 RepID=A0A835DUI5_9POAL|nr:hypothetical protein HU200_065863 [Digitaria exilis]
MIEWEEKLEVLNSVTLIQEEDTVIWALENSRNFAIASLYSVLTFPYMDNRWMMCIWTAKLALYFRVFLLQVCNDNLQSAEQLVKRIWSGNI